MHIKLQESLAAGWFNPASLTFSTECSDSRKPKENTAKYIDGLLPPHYPVPATLAVSDTAICFIRSKRFMYIPTLKG